MQAMTSADLHADFDIACFREPTIGDLLADPLTRALMKADHVDADDLERRLRARMTRAAPPRSAAAFKPVMSAPSAARARLPLAILARSARTSCGSNCAW